METRIYEAPQAEVLEIVVEQAILTASGDYPGYGDEHPL